MSIRPLQPTSGALGLFEKPELGADGVGESAARG